MALVLKNSLCTSAWIASNYVSYLLLLSAFFLLLTYVITFVLPVIMYVELYTPTFLRLTLLTFWTRWYFVMEPDLCIIGFFFFFCSIWLYPLDYIANLINHHYSQHCQKSPGRQDQAPHLTNTGSHWHLCIYTLIHSINVYRMHAMCQILEYNSKKKDIVLALSCL